VTDDNRSEDESRRVRIREVGPRDGFQNEPETIPTADKIRLIDALGRAGFKRIEIASFVRPDVIPQLSDGVEVLRGIDLPYDVARMVLVPNSRGLGNALAVRDLFEEVALFVSASQTHNQRNINRTIEETMADAKVMGKRIVAENLTFCAVIATSFGCPYEGKVPMDRVLGIADLHRGHRASARGRGHGAFPQHPRAGAGQRLCRARDGLHQLRVQLRRARRLPGAGRLDRQYRHRGPGEHVPRDGRRDRPGPSGRHRGRPRGAVCPRSQAHQPFPRRRAGALAPGYWLIRITTPEDTS